MRFKKTLCGLLIGLTFAINSQNGIDSKTKDNVNWKTIPQNLARDLDDGRVKDNFEMGNGVVNDLDNIKSEEPIKDIKSNFYKVAVFSGHIANPIGRNTQGCLSYSRVREYIFNDHIIDTMMENDGKDGIDYIFFKASFNIPLKHRPSIAFKEGSDLYIEIHHDSAQSNDIKAERWSEMEGFSLFYSKKNKYLDKSRKLAKLIGDEILDVGFKPNHYHTKDIKGERMNMIDPERAIYQKNFYVISKSYMPSVLFECGNLASPEEEKVMKQKNTRKKITGALHKAIVNYFKEYNKQ